MEGHIFLSLAALLILLMTTECVNLSGRDDIHRIDLDEGDTLTLTCKARPSLLRSYRWVYIREGTRKPRVLSSGRRLVVGEPRLNIQAEAREGHVALILTLNEIRPYEAGLFMCWRQGMKPDPQVLVRVLEAGLEEQEPLTVEIDGPDHVQYGGSTTITCIFKPSWPGQVLWLKDGQEIPTSDRMHRQSVEATSDSEGLTASLSIVSVRHPANFTCRVPTDPPTEESLSLDVKVARVESLTCDPEKDVVQYGQNLHISCVISGLVEEGAGISWLKDGSLLNPKEAGPGIQMFEQSLSNGFIQSSLRINDFSMEDNGHYACTAPGSSKDVLINIEGRPPVVLGVQGWDFVPGETLLLTCSTQYAKDKYVTWLFEGEPLPETWQSEEIFREDHYNITHHDLRIAQPTELYSGTYTCLAYFGSANTSVRDIVTPYFEASPPAHVEVDLGDSILLNCSVGGYPKPTVQWERYKDNQWLRIEEVLNRSMENTNGIELKHTENMEEIEEGEEDNNANEVEVTHQALSIEEAEFLHDGEYRCIGFNKKDTVSMLTMLEVIVPPEIVDLSTTDVTEGETLFIRCTVTNWREPVTFTRGSPSSSLPDDPRITVTVSETEPSVATEVEQYPDVPVRMLDNLSNTSKTFVLTIRDVRYNEGDQYFCHAGSKASKSVLVNVKYRPPEIVEVVASPAFEESEFFVSCTIFNLPFSVEPFFLKDSLALSTNDTRYSTHLAEKMEKGLSSPLNVWETTNTSFYEDIDQEIPVESEEVSEGDYDESAEDTEKTKNEKLDSEGLEIDETSYDSFNAYENEVTVKRMAIDGRAKEATYTLTIFPADVEDSGNYTCVVQGAESKSVEVDVTPKEEFQETVFLEASTSWIGGELLLKCSTTNHEDKFTFSHNTTLLVGNGSSNDRLEFTSEFVESENTSLTVHNLRITDVLPEDAGLYQCYSSPFASAEVNVTVHDLTDIRVQVEQPEEKKTLDTGDNLLLNCRIKFLPNTSYTVEFVHHGSIFALSNVSPTDYKNLVHDRAELIHLSRDGSNTEDNNHLKSSEDHELEQERVVETDSQETEELKSNEEDNHDGYEEREIELSFDDESIEDDQENEITKPLKREARDVSEDKEFGYVDELYVTDKLNTQESKENGENGGSFQANENETTLQLIVHDVVPEDAGPWTCSINILDAEFFMEANTQVDVMSPPQFVEVPEAEIEIQRGEDMILTCSAKGYPAPVVSWFKEDPKYLISNDSESAQIYLYGVEKEDSGIYTCEARGGSEIISSSTKIRIPQEVHIIDIPEKVVVVEESEEVVLFCSATGTDIPTVQWIKHDTGELMAQGEREAHVIILEMALRDEGVYTCIASIEGASSKESIDLIMLSTTTTTLTPTPSSTSVPTLVSGKLVEITGPKMVEVGQDIELMCLVSPVLSYYKYLMMVNQTLLVFDGTPTFHDPRMSVKTGSGGLNERILYLTISDATLADSGTYECSVNTEPVAKHHVTITIVPEGYIEYQLSHVPTTIPEKPENITASSTKTIEDYSRFDVLKIWKTTVDAVEEVTVRTVEHDISPDYELQKKIEPSSESTSPEIGMFSEHPAVAGTPDATSSFTATYYADTVDPKLIDIHPTTGAAISSDEDLALVTQPTADISEVQTSPDGVSTSTSEAFQTASEPSSTTAFYDTGEDYELAYINYDVNLDNCTVINAAVGSNVTLECSQRFSNGEVAIIWKNFKTDELIYVHDVKIEMSNRFNLEIPPNPDASTFQRNLLITKLTEDDTAIYYCFDQQDLGQSKCFDVKVTDKAFTSSATDVVKDELEETQEETTDEVEEDKTRGVTEYLSFTDGLDHEDSEKKSFREMEAGQKHIEKQTTPLATLPPFDESITTQSYHSSDDLPETTSHQQFYMNLDDLIDFNETLDIPWELDEVNLTSVTDQAPFEQVTSVPEKTGSGIRDYGKEAEFEVFDDYVIDEPSIGSTKKSIIQKTEKDKKQKEQKGYEDAKEDGEAAFDIELSFDTTTVSSISSAEEDSLVPGNITSEQDLHSSYEYTIVTDGAIKEATKKIEDPSQETTEEYESKLSKPRKVPTIHATSGQNVRAPANAEIFLTCPTEAVPEDITWKDPEKLLYLGSLDLAGIPGLKLTSEGKLHLLPGYPDVKDETEYTCLVYDYGTHEDVFVASYKIFLVEGDAIETSDSTTVSTKIDTTEPTSTFEFPGLEWQDVAVLSNSHLSGKSLTQVLNEGGIKATLVSHDICATSSDIRGWYDAQVARDMCRLESIKKNLIDKSQSVFTILDMEATLPSGSPYGSILVSVHNVVRKLNVHVFGPLVPNPDESQIVCGSPFYQQQNNGIDVSAICRSSVASTLLNLQESYLSRSRKLPLVK